MFPVDDGVREGGKLLRVAERVPCSGEDRYSWESRPHLRARCLFYAIAFGDIEEPATVISGKSCVQLRSLCENMVETLPTARRPEVRWQVLWQQLMIFVGNPFQEQTTDCANGSWQHKGHGSGGCTYLEDNAVEVFGCLGEFVRILARISHKSC